VFDDKQFAALWIELQRRAAASFAGAASVLVFRPGSSGGGENVFSTWPALVAAAQAVQGMKWIVIDDTIQPCEVPAGTWRLRGYAILVARPPSAGAGLAKLTFLDLAKLVDAFEFWGLELTSESSSHVMESGDYAGMGESVVFRLCQGSSLTVTGTARFFRTSSGPSASTWWLTDDSKLLTPTQAPSVLASVSRSTSLVVNADDLSVVERQTIEGNPNSPCSGVIVNAGAVVDADQTRASVVLAEDATREAYTPGDARAWRATAPANQQEAFDRIASAVSGLLGGPIP
jgi:hypothetical protein